MSLRQHPTLDVLPGDPSVVSTKYWHTLDDGRVQCDLCPRFCKLREGQRKFCFVRACQDGEVVLTTYGRSSGYCIDPIENKPLYHFLPGTPVLSFCTAGCKFCKNWHISRSREIVTLADQASPETIARAARELDCRGVAFTYNHSVIFMEYDFDVADACREAGVKTVAVTAGEIFPVPRAEFYRHLDAANIDVKAFTERFFRDICASHLQPALDTLEYFKHETSVWFELTTLLIPSENDSDAELSDICSRVVEELEPEVPLHFTAFHPDYRMQEAPSTPPETLRRPRELALRAGVRYAYTGNVHDPATDSTRCHSCGEKLIDRDWYELLEWRLTDDCRCQSCGTACRGVFDGPPGVWGARRHPVPLRDLISAA